MENDVVIRAESLGKKYLIGHEGESERYVALRDVVAHNVQRLRRTAMDLVRGRPMVAGDELEEFWALKDISFEIKRGEVTGVIGPNGAGKSTLLKILSRITEPSEGRVTIHGRVASLLEVGTGFHPELTGQENIFLNGAILGMSKKEIKAKFDEIVAFAEIEKFLDTPVKRYSSGMYVRLAFAIAAHLEPEILIVDEVLAVGDVQFQKKCLGKMQDVSQGGRTVLFVSHDMRKATALCGRGILLNCGKIKRDGQMATVADVYLTHRLNSGGFADLAKREDRSGSGEIQFQSIELLVDGEQRRTFAFREPLSQKIRIKVKERIGAALVQTSIVSSDGVQVCCFMNTDERCDWFADIGDYEFTVTIERLLLYPGTYSIELWVGDRNKCRIDFITEAISFTVYQGPNSDLERSLDQANGLVYQSAIWKHVKQ
jgi:lipopolysaccharide transport system ATP-binding protein